MWRARQTSRTTKAAIFLMAWTLTATTPAGATAAQDTDSGQPAETASPDQDAAAPATSLPVSLDQIRKDLAKGEAGEGLRGLNQTPHFKVEIVEQPQNWAPTFDKRDFSSPAVPGGNYAYELQQLMFPKTRYPLAQPYAAFSQGELLTVSLTTLLQQLLTPQVVKSVEAAQRRHDEQAARDELARALKEYCAAQPNGGAGVFGCDKVQGPN